jgi:Cu+-exporting ATPase
MDKTGTLTEGSPRVVRAIALNSTPVSEYLPICAALESRSEHPLARSIVKYADDLSVIYTDVDLVDQKSESGLGVFANSGKFDHQYRIGSLKFLIENGIDVTSARTTIQETFELSESVVALAVDKEVVALFGITDPIRLDAEAGINTLKALGAKVILASGDRSEVAGNVATKLHMDGFYGELKPQDKADLIARLKGEGAVVAMVGDGINDAPALAVADVGIAVGSGTAMAMASADITLVHGDVSAIADAIALSRATRRIIWQNLGWAFGYNLVLVPLAAFGILPPIYAALAMATSSVSVVLNSLRLKRFRLGENSDSGIRTNETIA